jgi:hypothetical protein
MDYQLPTCFPPLTVLYSPYWLFLAYGSLFNGEYIQEGVGPSDEETFYGR